MSAGASEDITHRLSILPIVCVCVFFPVVATLVFVLRAVRDTSFGTRTNEQAAAATATIARTAARLVLLLAS